VTGTTGRPSLTLTTCNPRFSQRQRLVVRAVQIYGAVPGGFMDQRHPGFSPLSP
jgi:sortase (surface protein transpeptidase)